jgi:glutamate synthase (NADPH/NADH) large chain
VHLALMEAGIRNRVEIWADGGYRHGHDIVKLHCLGANRVGFGTLAMVSLGCTICRGCQLDTCHVGIATQIETKEEADMKGLKKFTPQEFESSAENCTRFFSAMGEEVRRIVAGLGYERAQDIVGRSDLLVQSRAVHDVDVAEMIKPLEEFLDLEPIDLPSVEEHRSEPGLVVARPIRMKPKEASHELAALVTDVCSGTLVRRSYPRPTDADDRVLGTELAGELGSSSRRRRPPPPRTRWPTCASTAARWPARASAHSTSTGWTSPWRAAPRTAWPRPCSAARCRS